MSKTEVIALIGEPPHIEEKKLTLCSDYPETSFCLGDCAAAQASGATLYMV
ncbi:hypothetical protein ACFL2V_14385 [Pseudomonadota bacterium]